MSLPGQAHKWFFNLYLFFYIEILTGPTGSWVLELVGVSMGDS